MLFLRNNQQVLALSSLSLFILITFCVNIDAEIEENKLNSVYWDNPFFSYVQSIRFMKKNNCSLIAESIQEYDIDSLEGEHRFSPFNYLIVDKEGKLFLERLSFNQMLQEGNTRTMLHFHIAYMLNWIRIPLRFDADGHLIANYRKLFRVFQIPIEWLNLDFTLTVNDENTRNLLLGNKLSSFESDKLDKVLNDIFQNLFNYEEYNESLIEEKFVRLVSFKPTNMKLIGEIKALLNEQMLPFWADYALQYFRILNADVQLSDILSSKAMDAYWKQKRFDCKWRVEKWTTNKVNMLRAMVANDLSKPAFELKSIQIEPKQSIRLTADQYESILNEIEQEFSKCKQERSYHDSMFGFEEASLIATTLITLTSYAWYFQSMIPCLLDQWKKQQVQIELTPLQILKLNECEPKSEDEVKEIQSIFVRHFPDLKHKIEFASRFGLIGFNLLVQTNKNWSFDSLTRSRRIPTPQDELKTSLETISNEPNYSSIDFTPNDFLVLSQTKATDTLLIINNMSFFKLQKWIPFLIAKKFEKLFNFKVSEQSANESDWPFKQQFEFDIFSVHRPKTNFIYECFIVMMKQEPLTKFIEQTLPKMLYTYNLTEVYNEINNGDSNQQAKVIEFFNVRVEVDQQTSVQSADLSNVEIDFSNESSLNQVTFTKLFDQEEIKIKLNVLELGKMILFEVVSAIKASVGQSKLVEIVQKINQSAKIKLNPVKVHCFAMIGKLNWDILNNIKEIKFPRLVTGSGVCQQSERSENETKRNSILAEEILTSLFQLIAN